ncbi:caspase domain-containing protein [Trichoderma chlorosporum]
MVDSSPLPRKHWAILVGLDYYRHEKCLQGSVRDVLTMKEYLEAGPDPVDIAMLTATPPLDSSSCFPQEDQRSWPTKSNLENKLIRVIQNAKPGDFVYIHYSGHGAREPSRDKAAHQLGNLALTLFENDEHGISYFKGELLGKCLSRMVREGFLVSVVLDCCFSGSVMGTGDIRGVGIRSVDYDPVIAAATPPEHQDFLSSYDADYPLRDSMLQPNQWFVNPDGYTIISACGPHETAHELEVKSVGRRGALSYFLIETLHALRSRGVEITHESLYEYMRIKFHIFWPQQTPMRYGNKNFSFFSGPITTSSTPFTNIYTNGDSLCLDVGEAHGVHVGDTYTLHPPDWQRDIGVQEGSTPVTARVEAVHSLTSDLANIEPEVVKQKIKTETGWRAKPLTSLSQWKISVRLPASIYDQIQQIRAPAEQRYLHVCASDKDGEACMFNVVLDDQKCYKILDGLKGPIANLPAIPADAQEADQRLMDTLQHISQFKYAESIENRIPDASFEALFSLVSSVSGGSDPSNSAVFNVKHGGIWQLEIENKGKDALYFALFNFTPSWKVHNLLSASGRNGFWVLEPNCKEVLPLEMDVPEFLQSQNERCCEDIIKIFITNRAVSFPSMILPELPLYGSYHRGQPYDVGNGLSALITGLTGSLRGHHSKDEKWATRSYIIKTTIS